MPSSSIVSARAMPNSYTPPFPLPLRPDRSGERRPYRDRPAAGVPGAGGAGPGAFWSSPTPCAARWRLPPGPRVPVVHVHRRRAALRSRWLWTAVIWMLPVSKLGDHRVDFGLRSARDRPSPWRRSDSSKATQPPSASPGFERDAIHRRLEIGARQADAVYAAVHRWCPPCRALGRPAPATPPARADAPTRKQRKPREYRRRESTRRRFSSWEPPFPDC